MAIEKRTFIVSDKRSLADGVVTISPAQLGYLLEGIDWRAPQKTWRPQVAG